jgi:hypothetical protein
LLVRASVVLSSPILFTLMKEALSSTETSVLTRATRGNIPEDAILHTTQLFVISSKFKQHTYTILLYTNSNEGRVEPGGGEQRYFSECGPRLHIYCVSHYALVTILVQILYHFGVPKSLLECANCADNLISEHSCSLGLEPSQALLVLRVCNSKICSDPLGRPLLPSQALQMGTRCSSSYWLYLQLQFHVCVGISSQRASVAS